MNRSFCPRAQSRMKVERRANNKTVITGYAARFYDPNDPGTQYELWANVFERIMPGCFDGVLKANDCVALFNHNPDYVLGRSTKGTLRLFVDKLGLGYEIDPPDTQTARDLIANLDPAREDVEGSSFSFRCDGDGGRVLWAQEKEQEFREIYSISELIDVGPVTFPAYVATTAGTRSDNLLKEERDAFRADQQRARDQDAAEAQDILMRLRMLEVG